MTSEEYFTIKFEGKPGSGKTVAMEKIAHFLQQQGYVVTEMQGRMRDEEHRMRVNWSK